MELSRKRNHTTYAPHVNSNTACTSTASAERVLQSLAAPQANDRSPTALATLVFTCFEANPWRVVFLEDEQQYFDTTACFDFSLLPSNLRALSFVLLRAGAAAEVAVYIVVLEPRSPFLWTFFGAVSPPRCPKVDAQLRAWLTCSR